MKNCSFSQFFFKRAQAEHQAGHILLTGHKLDTLYGRHAQHTACGPNMARTTKFFVLLPCLFDRNTL